MLKAFDRLLAVIGLPFAIVGVVLGTLAGLRGIIKGHPIEGPIAIFVFVAFWTWGGVYSVQILRGHRRAPKIRVERCLGSLLNDGADLYRAIEVVKANCEIVSPPQFRSLSQSNESDTAVDLIGRGFAVRLLAKDRTVTSYQIR